MNFEQREKANRLAKLDARLEANPLDLLARGDWLNFHNSEYRLYVVEFESLNYCGAPEHCLVWAFNEGDAIDNANSWAEDFYREQDQSQWEDENGEEDIDDQMWASMRSAELLEDYEYAHIVEDPEQQRNFYQVVN